MDRILKVETKHAKIYKDRKAMVMTKINDAAKATVDDAVEVVKLSVEVPSVDVASDEPVEAPSVDVAGSEHGLSSPSLTTLCLIIFTRIK